MVKQELMTNLPLNAARKAAPDVSNIRRRAAESLTRAIFIFTLVIVLMGTQSNAEPPITMTLEEMEIIKTQVPLGSAGKGYVVADMTDRGFSMFAPNYNAYTKELELQCRNKDSALDEALHDFITKNKISVHISFPTNPPPNLELASAADLDKMFLEGSHATSKPDGWQRFHRRFANAAGLIRISRIGVDKKGTTAVIYFAHQESYLSGAGITLVLRKKDGKWTSDQSIGDTWQS